MANMLKEALSSDSKISSKRVITISSFLLMSAAFIGDLGWDLTVAEHVYNSMSYITIAGLGFTASEWLFSGKSPKDGNGGGGQGDYRNQTANSGYDRGYKDGYQAGKEACLSGNSETEADMY